LATFRNIVGHSSPESSSPRRLYQSPRSNISADMNLKKKYNIDSVVKNSSHLP